MFKSISRWVLVLRVLVLSMISFDDGDNIVVAGVAVRPINNQDAAVVENLLQIAHIPLDQIQEIHRVVEINRSRVT